VDLLINNFIKRWIRQKINYLVLKLALTKVL
jgi:hypothetical protein